MDFDTPEQLVQDFLNRPPRSANYGGVVVSMTYPQLVELTRSAYRAGMHDERSRREVVSPFAPSAQESSRFANLELRDLRKPEGSSHR